VAENFNLWNAWADEGRTRVTFFATSTGFQRINRGTKEMISEMLSDLGCPHDQIKDWSVKAFATDYLSVDLHTKDWEDRWNHSYEVKVRMKRPVKFSTPNKYLVENLSGDETWDGEEPVPDTCVVVADFPSETERERFERAARSKSKDLTLEKSPAHDRQTLISMPAGEAFFIKGAKLAVGIERLVHEFGGTSQWRGRFTETDE
jgi:hypothetical protein